MAQMEDFSMIVLNTYSFTVREVLEMKVTVRCIKQQCGKKTPKLVLKT